jgi:hypothetical protein
MYFPDERCTALTGRAHMEYKGYMLIITGTGRSGTATLARLFGGHHEFRVGYLLDKYFSKADPHSDPFPTMGRRIEAMLDLHQGVDLQTFVDSSNLYIHFIDAIAVLNPPAKFILCVRNGKDFVRSAFSRKWHEMRSFGAVPQSSDPYFVKWKRMTPLQRNAWIWTYRNKKALQGLSTIPERRKLIVRIEDIGKARTLDMLEEFAGIKVADKGIASHMHNANPSLALPSREEWTEEMAGQFDEIAADMMRFFNYG